MKSLTEITENINRSIATTKTSEGHLVVDLPARPAPLSGDEIAKIQTAINKHFTVKKEETYGYVPVVEGDAAIRQEFDITGEITTYKPRMNVPTVLWETMLRPAPPSHVIYHLGRLAAHRRNTRGSEAFQVVVEDISVDVGEVSEWAVVMACIEMRQKNSAWFPNTGEILTIIKKYSAMLDELYLKRVPAAQIASATVPKVRLNRNAYYANPKENPLRRELCDFLISHGKEDYFEMDRLYSNYNLEGMAHGLGWRPPTQ